MVTTAIITQETLLHSVLIVMTERVMVCIPTANSEIGYAEVGKHTRGVDRDFKPEDLERLRNCN
jgi:hypothetical protein